MNVPGGPPLNSDALPPQRATIESRALHMGHVIASTLYHDVQNMPSLVEAFVLKWGKYALADRVMKGFLMMALGVVIIIGALQLDGNLPGDKVLCFPSRDDCDIVVGKERVCTVDSVIEEREWTDFRIFLLTTGIFWMFEAAYIVVTMWTKYMFTYGAMVETPTTPRDVVYRHEFQRRDMLMGDVSMLTALFMILLGQGACIIKYPGYILPDEWYFDWISVTSPIYATLIVGGAVWMRGGPRVIVRKPDDRKGMA